MTSRRYFVSCSFNNGRVDMGKVKLADGVTSFSQLVKEVIACPIEINLTRAQFLALDKKERDDKKKVAYIVPGTYREDEVPRDSEHVPHACPLVILDIDQGANKDYPARRFTNDPEQLRTLLDPFAFVAYRTANSTPESPKLRIIVSAADIPATEYPRAVAFVANKLGLEDGDYDKVSIETTRAMYRPVHFRGDTSDPIVDAIPDGEDITEIDIADVDAPQRSVRGRRTTESDDIEFLRTPLEGFTAEDARDALSYVDPDCGYNQWLEICMSLKHQFPREPEASEAFEVFEAWSSTAKQKYEGREVTREKWDAVSVTAKGRAPRTIRSLIYYAEEAGWSSVQFCKRSYLQLQEWITSQDRSAMELMQEGVKKIAGALLESPVERDVLLTLLQRRMTSLKMPVSRAVLKKQLEVLLRSVKTHQDQAVSSLPESQLPTWARGLVYVSDTNEFYHRATDRCYTPETLNNTHEAFLNPDAQTGKVAVEPKDYLLNIAKIPRVSNYLYSPKDFDQAIVKHRQKKFVNTYHCTYPEPDASDILAGEIIHEHVRNLIAEEKYQQLLIDFLAYHVQRPGAKIRWAVLLQGAQGCGKTAIFNVMQSVLGQENAKAVNAEELMQGQFTSWGTGAQLCAIEEVRVVGENRHAVMNKLKPYVTNDDVSIRKLYQDSYMTPNCTNYMMFTNHHDALAVQEGDRRYFVLQSRLQTREQVADLGEDYFKHLFHTVKFRGAGVRAWLEAWHISEEFDPDGHAPETPFFHDMVDAAATPLSNSIREMINDGDHPMVKADLISSHFIGTILKEQGFHSTPSAIGSILRELGYVKAGRVRLGEERHNIWIRHTSQLYQWQEIAAKRFESIGGQHFENLNSELL